MNERMMRAAVAAMNDATFKIEEILSKAKADISTVNLMAVMAAFEAIAAAPDRPSSDMEP